MSDQEEQLSEEEMEDEEEEAVTEAIDAPPAPETEVTEPTEETEETEEGEEEGGDETPSEAPQETRRSSRATVVQEVDPATLSEAQQAMLAAKKRQEQESELRAMDADSRRKQELQNIEAELVELKRRQEERRQQRILEEKEEAVRRQEEAVKRKADEEERRSKMEFEKQRRAEEKYRRQQAAGSFAGFGEEVDVSGAGRNFVISATGQKQEQDKKEKKGGMTAEQKAAAKANYMSIVGTPVDTSNMMPNDIKAKIKQLHAKITRLESEKYDLEKRHERQDYDMKELDERQAQRNRNKAIASGADPAEEQTAGRPPKVVVASKHDRQVDRRSYKEKYDIFESPNVKPPPSIVRGSGRPPPEWRHTKNDKMEELETLRKNLDTETPRYIEVAPVEGDAAKPPVDVIPMVVPTEDFDPSLAERALTTKPFGEGRVAAPAGQEPVENGDVVPTSPTGGDTELEIVEEPVEA